MKPVKVWRHTLVGTVETGEHAASDALSMIGREWDNAKFIGETSGHFEFELDGHRFTVAVRPVVEP